MTLGGDMKYGIMHFEPANSFYIYGTRRPICAPYDDGGASMTGDYMEVDCKRCITAVNRERSITSLTGEPFQDRMRAKHRQGVSP